MSQKFIIGIFEDEDILLEGAKKIREQGVKIKNVYLPYPVHGMEEALDLRYTRIPRAGFIIGAVTAVSIVSIMGWITAIDYPMNFGGKPTFPWPSFVPPTFEGTVLLTSIGMAAIMFYTCWLVPSPNKHPVDVRATDDKFVMVVDPDQEKSKQEIEKILKSNGATETEEKELDT